MGSIDTKNFGLAYDRDMILDTAEYVDQFPSVSAFESLQWWVKYLPHDEMVEMVNEAGLTTGPAALIVRAWVAVHGFTQTVLEFDTAICGGGHPGEVLAYRVSKKTWGKLVAVREDSGVRPAGTDPECLLRLWFALKENSPIMNRQKTRNELKAVLGRDGRDLVGDALRSSQAVFLQRLSSPNADLILRRTNLSPVAFWRAVKNGDAELVARLGLIPSADRERMRKRGMYVAAPLQQSLPM